MQYTDSEMLRGRVAWVTASARGIGRAIAERLGRCGAAVAIHGRSEETAAEFKEAPSTTHVAEELEQLGCRAEPFFGDLSDPDTACAVAEEIQERLGPIDILVNNAGGDIGADRGKPDPNDAIGISPRDISAVMDRNLLTTVFCCQAVVSQMPERRAGRIVNIGSADAFTGSPGGGPLYATAKAAQTHYTRCLAGQLRELNITVNMIAPGGVPSRRFLATRQADPDLLRAMDTPTLIRYGHVDEIARVVQFLVSPLADFVSGQIIRVDGGYQLSPA